MLISFPLILNIWGQKSLTTDHNKRDLLDAMQHENTSWHPSLPLPPSLIIFHPQLTKLLPFFFFSFFVLPMGLFWPLLWFKLLLTLLLAFISSFQGLWVEWGWIWAWMGNGTTCNLHLVKQNAKKKGEVSTGLFFLFFSHCGVVGLHFFSFLPRFPFTSPASYPGCNSAAS